MMVADASQFTVALRIGLAGLPRRLGSSVVLVASVACTIGVLVSILALSSGLQRAYLIGGSQDIAVVFPVDALLDERGSLSRSDVLTVLDAPGIARDGDVVLASPEFRLQLPPVPHAADGSIKVRGVPPAGLAAAIRPEFHLVSGRMFRPGAQELIIGAGLARVHGTDIGSGIFLPDGEWPVVGTFTDGGSIAEGDLMGDAETLLSSMRRNSFSRVLVALQTPDAYERFASWLRDNPGLHVSVERQPDYLRHIGGAQAQYFSALAYAIGCVMALGALFACVKILYASVSVRAQEMATLRAMGYARLPVAASVLAEGVVLAVIGALLGGGVAWLLFDGRPATDFDRAFNMAVTPGLVLAGTGWAALLALAGGAIPALRAARLEVIEVLRGA